MGNVDLNQICVQVNGEGVDFSGRDWNSRSCFTYQIPMRVAGRFGFHPRSVDSLNEIGESGLITEKKRSNEVSKFLLCRLAVTLGAPSAYEWTPPLGTQFSSSGPLLESILVYWPFDDTFKPVRPATHGKLKNPKVVGFDKGRFGSAVNFPKPARGKSLQAETGYGGHLDFEDSESTIQMWVYWHSLDREQVLIESYDGRNGWTLTKLSDQRLRFDAKGVRVTAGDRISGQLPSLSAQRWHHVVVRRKAAGSAHSVVLFIDGDLIADRPDQE